MLDIHIRQAQVQHRLEDVLPRQELTDCRTGAAHDGVFFKGHQQRMAAGDLAHQGFVQWFDEAHVHHRGVDLLGHFQGFSQLHAEHQQGNVAALATHDALADLDRLKVLFDHGIRAVAPRVTHSRRAVVQVAGAEHLAQFVLVARGHHQHAGDAAQVR